MKLDLPSCLKGTPIRLIIPQSKWVLLSSGALSTFGIEILLVCNHCLISVQGKSNESFFMCTRQVKMVPYSTRPIKEMLEKNVKTWCSIVYKSPANFGKID